MRLALVVVVVVVEVEVRRVLKDRREEGRVRRGVEEVVAAAAAVGKAKVALLLLLLLLLPLLLLLLRLLVRAEAPMQRNEERETYFCTSDVDNRRKCLIIR